MDKAARDNRSNQLNPNNDAYYSSRAGNDGGDGGGAYSSNFAPDWSQPRRLSKTAGAAEFHRLIKEQHECHQALKAAVAQSQRPRSRREGPQMHTPPPSAEGLQAMDAYGSVADELHRLLTTHAYAVQDELDRCGLCIDSRGNLVPVDEPD